MTTAIIPSKERPSPVAVYVQAKPAMEPNLRVVLRLLNEPAGVRAFPWQDLRYEHVSAIRKLLADNLVPSYASKCLVAVRGVLRTAWKMRVIDTDTFMRAIDVEPIKGNSPLAGRMLTKAELHALFQRVKNPRDRAILALITYAGLRREEVASLDREHFQGAALAVTGKGRKHREVFLPTIAQGHVQAWLDVRGDAPGPLFWRFRSGGRPLPKRRGKLVVKRQSKPVPNRRLSASGVWQIVRCAAQEARIKNVTPHDFRRTFASTLFDEGVDPITVQKLMGHDDPKTTARYDRRGDEAKRNAAEALARAFEDA